MPEYDESVDGRVTVKKGDVNVMTYEDLPGGGWVITSGVTFFSNYDIKSDQDYANRFILRNILNSPEARRDRHEDCGCSQGCGEGRIHGRGHRHGQCLRL